MRWLVFLLAVLACGTAAAQQVPDPVSGTVAPGSILGRLNPAGTSKAAEVANILGQYAGSLDLKPPTGPAQAIKSTQNFTGTAASDLFMNQIHIASDALSAPQHNVFGFGVYQVCCAPAAQGWRFATAGRIDVNTPWSAADPEAVFVGGVFNARAQVAAASPGAYLGGSNSNVQLSAGANGWASVAGMETDMTLVAGVTQPQVKWGHVIVQGTLDAVFAFGLDYGLAFTNAGTSGGWRQLINIDSMFGASPVALNGTVMGMRGPATFANGIDFSQATITGAAFVGAGGNSIISGAGEGIFQKITSHGQVSVGGVLGVGVYPAIPAASTFAISASFLGNEVVQWNQLVGGQGIYFRQKTGASSSVVMGAFLPDAPVLGNTALMVYVNNTTGGKNEVNVSLGAPDSGGAGYRVMRVPN